MYSVYVYIWPGHARRCVERALLPPHLPMSAFRSHNLRGQGSGLAAHVLRLIRSVARSGLGEVSRERRSARHGRPGLLTNYNGGSAAALREGRRLPSRGAAWGATAAALCAQSVSDRVSSVTVCTVDGVRVASGLGRSSVNAAIGTPERLAQLISVSTALCRSPRVGDEEETSRELHARDGARETRWAASSI